MNQAMFVQRIPTYVVSFRPKWDDPNPLTLRMSQDQVEGFVRILMFNNILEFSASQEVEASGQPD